jgi:Tol biopolymer transport system component
MFVAGVSVGVVTAGSLLVASAGGAEPRPGGGATRRVSVSSAEHQANGYSVGPAISSGGRYVAFESLASNLAPGDTNDTFDVFVRDRSLGTTRRVSVSSAEHQANGFSAAPAISWDGRYVALTSFASNLVPGDTNGATDVFVRDRRLGTTRRVSVSSSGGQGNNHSGEPAMSADGRFVAFESEASDLVPGDTNNRGDMFVRDLKLGTTRRVSLSSSDRQADDFSSSPAMSADGRYVAFVSFASNLVPGDTNLRADVFVRDRQLGTTSRVSVSSAERQANNFNLEPSVSADGHYVVFTSRATNLIPDDSNTRQDVFVRDLRLGTTRRISVSSAEEQGSRSSGNPAISRDGRYVAFKAVSSNLVPSDTNGFPDVFVRDRKLGVTHRVSVAGGGEQVSGKSDAPAMTADGRFVAFVSEASDLVPGDTNANRDVFVRDRGATLAKVTLRFTDCARCSVQMINAGGGWESPIKTADHGLVRFRVTPIHTRGSIFFVGAPWADSLYAAPLIAVHYRGFQLGSLVSRKQSARAKAATPCWMGTRGEPRVLVVRTARFRSTTTSGDPAIGVRAWFNRTGRRMGPYFRPLDHGAVLVQDAPPCG